MKKNSCRLTCIMLTTTIALCVFKYKSNDDCIENDVKSTETQKAIISYENITCSTEIHKIPDVPEETIKFNEKIKENYDKNTNSYKIAEQLLTDYNQNYLSDDMYDWLLVWKTDMKNNKQLFETADIILLDMDGDDFNEAIIRINISFSSDRYYYIYSLKDSKVLLKKYYYDGGKFKLFKKDDKIIFSSSSAFPGFTSIEYYELTDQKFNYESKISSLSSPEYADERLKLYYFLYEKHDIKNPFKRFDGIKEINILPESGLEQFLKEKNDFESSMVLCTDEFKSISIMNTDFKNFDTLVEALKPLDNYMEKDSENQTGNSDAK